MSGPRGRGRGRGRGWGGQNFQNQQQHFSDGDMAMSDTREFAPRGRGRGRGRGQPFQQYHEQHQPLDGDMAMSDNREFAPRGRGRGRGRGQPFQQHQEQHQNHPLDGERAQAKDETVSLLEGFLGRRYDPTTKLLDLSAIALDEAVRRSGMFDNERTQKKFFPALMVVCDKMLPTRDQKIAAIESVSLANNNVPNLNVIYELVKSLNHIKNLDLSGNAFASLLPLKPWKNRFKSLEHLIVDPFPEAGWEDELTAWFPRLRILNGKQVRPDADTSQAPAAVALAYSSTPAATPVNTEEQQKKEEMIAFVQQATNLNRDYAIQCLEAGQWDLQQASDLFAQSRHTLPPNAFV
jgi:nuclear RNA export factor